MLTAYWNAILVHPIMALLISAYGLLRDFGLAIVLVAIGVPLILYPLYRDRVNNAAMGSLPLLVQNGAWFVIYMVVLQVRLYRARGNNPAAIRMPLFIETPILAAVYIAFYAGLLQLPQLSGNDISQFILPSFIPNPVAAGSTIDLTAHWLPWLSGGLGRADPLHILPILIGLTQLIASIMGRQIGELVAGQGRGKTLGSMLIVPSLMLFVAWQLPAALCIYGLSTTVFQIVQRYFVSGWGQLPHFVPFLVRPAPGAVRASV